MRIDSTDEEYEKKIIDLINSDYNGWSKAANGNGIDVYKNDVSMFII